MGPQSGIYLNNRIVCQTKAETDQQHLSTILMSFPGEIGDRTMFLEGRLNMNPAYSIIPIINKMKGAGATVIGMACNTAHSPEIFDIISSSVEEEVKLLNMPRETCEYIRKRFRHVKKVGVLATNGTCKSGIYKKTLLSMGFEVIDAEPWFQGSVIHEMVYNPRFGIKANSKITEEVKLLLDDALSYFAEKNADAVILGCTEFSLLEMDRQARGMEIVDSTDAFAQALIREATKKDA